MVANGGGGFENAPNSFIEEYIKYDLTYGDCYVKRGARRIPLTKTPDAVSGFVVKGKKSSSWKSVVEVKREGLIIEDGDSIVTGNGFVFNISCLFPPDLNEKESRMISLFPNSEVVIHVKSMSRTEKSVNPDGSEVTSTLDFSVIDSFELVKGLFNVAVKTRGDIKEKLIIPSSYPSITFKPAMGEFGKDKSVSIGIELNNDGSLTIFNCFMTAVVHDRTHLEAGRMDPLNIIGNPKIVVTRDALYVTDTQKHPDPRIEAVNKRMLEVGKFLSHKNLESGYKEMTSKETLEKKEKERVAQIKQEIINEECRSKPDLKIIAFLKSQLTKTPSVIVSNEHKSLMERGMAQLNVNESVILSPFPGYSPVLESDKVVVKEVKRTAKNYQQIIEEYTNKNTEITDALTKLNKNDTEFQYFKRMYAQGKSVPGEIVELIKKEKTNRASLEKGVQELSGQKGVIAQTAASSVSASLKYLTFNFVFTKVEKGTELNFNKAPAGKEYLMIYYDVTHTGKGQGFFSPDEEVRLLVKGEVIPLRNYRMETNMDSGKTYTNEQFFFVIPENVKEFTLEMGKKILPKVSVNLHV